MLVLAVAAIAAGCSWGPARPDEAPGASGDWARWDPPVVEGESAATAAADDAATAHGPAGPAHAPALQAVNLATGLIGSPYRWGGATPAGFDCSGLVYYTFGKAGVSVPRTSQQQFNAAQPIELHEALPGDLVFFAERGRIFHVGIYLGDDRFIHAPDRGRAVSVASLSEGFYRSRFAGAGRLCC
jgi:cell wall-associated NlpC family hydrolase